MTDTSGICVCFGSVQDEVLLENAKLMLQDMRAKWSDKIQIDTTHFVCTTPAATVNGAQTSGSRSEASSVEYQKALQLSIPVVQPHWILACHTEKRMIPIASFYLGASPSTYSRAQSMSQANFQPSTTNANTVSKHAAYRSSMPTPSRITTMSPPNTDSINQSSGKSEHRDRTGGFEPTPEEMDGRMQEGEQTVKKPAGTDKETRRKSRPGTMDMNFRFPTTSPSPPTVPDLPSSSKSITREDDVGLTMPVVTPSSVEVPPPPPVEKERVGLAVDDGEEDVGETEEIELN